MRYEPVEFRTGTPAGAACKTPVSWNLLLCALLFVASDASAGRALDSNPPARIADLTLIGFNDQKTRFDMKRGDLRGAPLALAWTAPGDDSTEGTAWRYDVRIRPVRLEDETWTHAILLNPLQVPLPSASGTRESITIGRITGLVRGTRYAIAIKAYDETGNPSRLSNIAFFTTPGTPPVLADTIPIGDMELWVAGRRVEGPTVVCSYDAYEVRIGNARLPDSEAHPEWTNEDMKRVYGSAPFVQRLVDKGVSFKEAGLRFSREIEDVMNRARMLSEEHGDSASTTYLRRHPLVERVEGAVFFTGMPGGYMWMSSRGMLPETEPVPGISIDIYGVTRNHDKAQDLFDTIRRTKKTRDHILYLTFGATMSWGGSETRSQFDAQIEHIYVGLPLETLPRGPLTERLAREIKDALR